MSRDCCVALPHGAMGCLQFVIVVFLDHTHLLFFMMSPYDNYQGDVIEAFNSTSRYLDDSLNINNPCFEQMVGLICPTELQLNKANSFYTESPFMDFLTVPWVCLRL